MSNAVSYAQYVLQRYWDKFVPVEPTKMIERMTGIQLKYDATLPDHISGKIECVADNDYLITVNANHHENRQRFTIAHELGHYFLRHGNKHDTFETMYRDGHLNAEEMEANTFAAELLMPSNAIKHCVFEENMTNIETLAEKFWVSNQAMLIRLNHLGLI